METPGTPISWTKRPQSLNTVIDTLEQAQASDLVLARTLYRLYWNRPMAIRSLPTTTGEMDLERYSAMANAVLNQLGFNLCRELIDSLAARVCRQMACKVLTVAGDSALQQQSVRLTRAIDGFNLENNTRQIGENIFIDAAAGRGFGACKVYFDKDAKELKLMQLDCMGVFYRYGEGPNPRSIFTRTAVPIEYLCDTYPSKADSIVKAGRNRRPLIAGVEPSGAGGDDTILVNEGWKLAGADRKGKWAMTVGQVVLDVADYPHDFHQVILFRVLPEYIGAGAGGVAIARLAAPYHRWMNQLVLYAHESFKGNLPKVVRNALTVVNQGGTSNIPFGELIWEGPSAPEVVPGNVVSEQVLNYIPQVGHFAHAHLGINENMSTGEKPTGINSQPALREYRGFVDQRLNGINERWAQLWADIGKAWVGVGAENFKNESFVLRCPGSEALQEVKWSEIDLKKNKYRMQFDVTSGLSNSAAGKMQDVGELMDLGQVDATDAGIMLKSSIPDIAATVDEAFAPRSLARKLVDDALDGNFSPPSTGYGPDFLNSCVLIGTRRLCKATSDGNRTPEQMETLRKFIRAAQRKLKAPVPQLPAVVPVPSAPAIPQNAVRGAGFVPPAGPPPQAPQVPPVA